MSQCLDIEDRIGGCPPLIESVLREPGKKVGRGVFGIATSCAKALYEDTNSLTLAGKLYLGGGFRTRKTPTLEGWGCGGEAAYGSGDSPNSKSTLVVSAGAGKPHPRVFVRILHGSDFDPGSFKPPPFFIQRNEERIADLHILERIFPGWTIASTKRGSGNVGLNLVVFHDGWNMAGGMWYVNPHPGSAGGWETTPLHRHGSVTTPFESTMCVRFDGSPASCQRTASVSACSTAAL